MLSTHIYYTYWFSFFMSLLSRRTSGPVTFVPVLGALIILLGCCVQHHCASFCFILSYSILSYSFLSLGSLFFSGEKPKVNASGGRRYREKFGIADGRETLMRIYYMRKQKKISQYSFLPTDVS